MSLFRLITGVLLCCVSTQAAHVVTLTDADFQNKVPQSTKPFFIQFFAPWCVHCRNMEPLWEDLATHFQDKISVGRVDCTVATQTRMKYSINAFPTLKLFLGNRIVEFRGPRTFLAFENFLHRHNALKDNEEAESHVLYSMNYQGDTEVIRLIMEEVGVEYEEVRLDANWESVPDSENPPAVVELKEQLRSLAVPTPFHLPALRIGSRLMVSTPAIIRHLARTHALYGTSDADAYDIDYTFQFLQEARERYEEVVSGRCGRGGGTGGEGAGEEGLSPEDWDRCLGEFRQSLEVSESSTSTNWIDWLDALIEANQWHGGYVSIGSLSWVDLYSFDLLSKHLGLLGRSLFEGLHYIQDWFISIGTRDNLSDYLSRTTNLSALAASSYSPTGVRIKSRDYARPENVHPEHYRWGNSRHPVLPEFNPFNNSAPEPATAATLLPENGAEM